jgi:hypothetical protein
MQGNRILTLMAAQPVTDLTIVPEKVLFWSRGPQHRLAGLVLAGGHFVENLRSRAWSQNQFWVSWWGVSLGRVT